MLGLLWLIPALPLLGFILLALVGRRLSRAAVSAVGVGSVGLSALVCAGVWASFVLVPPSGHAFSQTLWTWLRVDGLRTGISLYLDPLSLVMAGVVTGVGFLIHLYSAEFMNEDADYARFFAYMNLFVGSMLILVLAGNLLLLYLGWEGVGLCSYLLIGFWYRDPGNGLAARKAFLVTRVGDTALIIGLFLLFTRLGTLDIQTLLARASQQWNVGAGVAVAAAALLLGGAVGKSAQLPLQVWLPDAMAGPTPVSALIHAATMVTAGVYLIARTHALFVLAPPVLAATAIIGAATLLLSGFSALTQRDIKRILAYSTMSQIGYMFLALGVGAWSAAIFHLVTHAFFKALLFLGAGAVILGVHHKHDIFEMGGLRKELPLTFWTFLIAGASLAGFPLVTAGFYSKDLILSESLLSARGSVWLWAAGVVGAFLTGLYIFRLIFVVFFGEAGTPVERRPALRMQLPMAVLAVLSAVAGFVEIPSAMGGVHLFSSFLETALPGGAAAHGGRALDLGLMSLSGAVSLLAIYVAYLWYFRRPRAEAEETDIPGVAGVVQRFWFRGWGFDSLYDVVFVRPFVWAARWDKDDFPDLLYRGIAALVRLCHGALALTQNGLLRWYSAGLVGGAILILSILVLL